MTPSEKVSAIFLEMLAVAESRKKPTEYKTDLTVHDRIKLESICVAEPFFLWAIRQSGTHLIDLNAETSTQPPEKLFGSCPISDDMEWFIFRGIEITAITRSAAQTYAYNAAPDFRKKGAKHGNRT